VLTPGSSATANNAQADSIQLSNKGMTAVDGLLANGFNQGNAKHTTKMMLRTKGLWLVDECMQRFSITQNLPKQRRP
jgi:hypothetical protein